MNREWRAGSVELVEGYRLVGDLGDVLFAIEGGFVNIKVPGVDHIQIVSAPAIRAITCRP
ncbi:hypothetical protein [Nonomuraea africana]|uniref:Uncharacterized protein n=1 Tax=Nonomuraea africana TaxID=46171 RepID=A0ABR9KNS0_9ACTN|nr:hypothetical protein [Nonomuraea africana]MBE1563157.1 hypothetical protein [Nonomuraea africana]